MRVRCFGTDDALVDRPACDGGSVQRDVVVHVPAVSLARVAASVFNVSVDEGTADVQVAVLSFLHEGVCNTGAVRVVTLVDAHSRDADVVKGVFAAEDFVVIVLGAVVAVLKDFAQVGPGGDVLVAFGGFGGLHALFVLAVQGVVPHFSVDFKSSVLHRAVRNNFTRHFNGGAVIQHGALGRLRGVRVRFVVEDFNVLGGSNGHVGDVADVGRTEGSVGDLSFDFDANVDFPGVETVRAVGRH